MVAEQFYETLEPLSDWLTATEKRLANSEPIGTQTAKLEEQISQHKVQGYPTHKPLNPLGSVIIFQTFSVGFQLCYSHLMILYLNSCMDHHLIFSFLLFFLLFLF